MSDPFDAEVSERLRAAADAAGAGADPDAAAAAVEAAGSAAPPVPLRLIAGLGAISLVVGVTLGATALRPGGDPAAALSVDTTPGVTYDCPDGAEVGALRPGDRVFVIGRDEGGGWSAMRDPRDLASTVWLPTAALTPDPGSDRDVPVIECDRPVPLVVSDADPIDSTTTLTTTSTTTSTTSPISTTLPPSTPTTLPPSTTTTLPPSTTTTLPPSTTTTLPPSTTTTTTEAPDTVQPTINSAVASNPVISSEAPCTPVTSQIVVDASDNVGVVSVSGTYSGLPDSPLSFSFSSGAWRATFGPFPGLDALYDENISITITAQDAAGNSDAAGVVVNVKGCFI